MKKQGSFFNQIITKSERSSLIFLLLLLSADFAFIILHLVCKFNIVENWEESVYNIAKDRGCAEFFVYIKYVWIILLLIYIIITTKRINYISWVLVFLYFLLDDSFQIHERTGNYFAMNFNFNVPLNLRLQDMGELSALAFFGIILFIILAITYFWGSRHFKKVSVDLLIFVVLFAIFAVFFDMLYVAINLVGYGLGVLEESGEMMTVSCALWYVFMLALKKDKSDFYLHELFLDSVRKKKNE